LKKKRANRKRLGATSALGNARPPPTLPHPYEDLQNRSPRRRWHRT
jgi:hypothetical protein